MRSAEAIFFPWGAGLLACLAVACHSSAPAPAATPEAASTPSNPGLAEQLARRDLFLQLVSDIRKFHLFSDAWPEKSWAATLPALEQEVTGAADRTALLIALSRVADSLRDGHLAFTPTGGWSNPGIAVLPLSFLQTGPALAPRFFVARANAATGLAAGDELVRYDGVEAASLLEHFAPELNRASPAARADQLAELLQWRRTETHQGLLGAKVSLQVKRSAELVGATAVFAPNLPPPTSTSDAPACRSRQRDFGAGYELARASEHLCLYRGTNERTRPYPIVRHHAFLYSGSAGIDYAAIEQDHQLVKEFLAATPHLAGVLLDLRDNGGGHHSDLFLPWYLSTPYERTLRWIRLHPELTDRSRLTQALWGPSAAEEYVRRASAGEAWWTAPFECSASECPQLKHPLVTQAPIAVLVGPRCKSSCDTFVHIWSQQHAGPTVGEPAAAMLTSNRYPLDVRLGSESLGQLTVALSGVRSSEHEPWLEGRPGPVDELVEQSWPAVEYEQRVIEAAVRALGRSVKRGPRSRPE